MNEQRLQQEPSMEEILASIRRIISEDEAASSKNRAPTGPTAPASASGVPSDAVSAAGGNGSSPTVRHHAPETHQPADTGYSGDAHSGGAYSGGAPAIGDPSALSVDTARPFDGGDGANLAPDTQHYDATPQGYAEDGGYYQAGTDPAAYDDPSVLDLTEMVAEDGSVVTIAPVSADVAADGYGDANVYDEQGGYDDTLYSEQNVHGQTQQDGYADPAAHAYSADGQAQDAAAAHGETLVLTDDQASSGHGQGEWPADAHVDTAYQSAEFEQPHHTEQYDAAAAVHETNDQGDQYPPADETTAPDPNARTTAVLRQGPREDDQPDRSELPTSKPGNARRLNSALAALAGGDTAEESPKPEKDDAVPAKADEPKSPDPRTVRQGGRDVRVVAATTPTVSADEPAKAEAPASRETVSPDAVSRDDAKTLKAATDMIESPALEGMIREAMKPMLQEWLDKNLSRLVEDVARQELSRMIERRGGL